MRGVNTRLRARGATGMQRFEKLCCEGRQAPIPNSAVGQIVDDGYENLSRRGVPSIRDGLLCTTRLMVVGFMIIRCCIYTC